MIKRLLMPLFLFDKDDGGGGGGGDGGDDGGEGGDKDRKPAGAAGGDDAGGDEKDRKPAGEQKPPWGDDENFDAGRAWSKLQGVEADKEKQRQRAEKAEAELKKRQDAEKSEQQKLEDRADDAEKRATEAEAKAMRYEVALDKGLTKTQAKRLVGNNPEELAQDAEELLESFKGDGDDGEAPPRTPRERLRPGAAPSSDPEETDPEKLAEQVPRG